MTEITHSYLNRVFFTLIVKTIHQVSLIATQYNNCIDNIISDCKVRHYFFKDSYLFFM